MKNMPLPTMTQNSWTKESIQRINTETSTLQFMLGANKIATDEVNVHQWRAVREPEITGDVITPPQRRYGLVAELMPYYDLQHLVRMTVESHGLTLDTNVSTLPNYKPYFVSLHDTKSSLNQLDGYCVFASVNSAVPATMLASIAANTNTINSARAMRIVKPIEVEYPTDNDLDVLRYTASNDGKVKVTLSLTSQTASEVSNLLLRVSRYYHPEWTTGQPVVESLYSEENVTVADLMANPRVIEVDMKINDDIYIEAYRTVPDMSEFQMAFRVDFEYLQEGSGVGSIYNANTSSLFKTQYSVLDLFAKVYGLKYSVQGDAVRAMAESTLYDNILYSDDWTDKLDMASAIEYRFTLPEYAQHNAINGAAFKYQQEQPEAVIVVDNESIDVERTVFTLPVVTDSRPTEWYDGPAANVLATGYLKAELIGIRPISEYQGNVYNEHKIYVKDEVPAFIVTKGQSRDESIYRNNKFDLDGVQLLPYYAEVVDISDIKANYDILESRVLNGVRVIEADFYLTSLDIRSFDFYTPIYLEQFGDYFYVQKISNFVPEKLSRVTLVCLNTLDDGGGN